MLHQWPRKRLSTP